MRSKMFLCAQDVLLNAYTNDVSVINIFESMEVRQFPLNIPRMMWLNMLERDASEPAKKSFDLTVFFDDQEAYRISVLADFGLGLSNRCLAVMLNVSIPGPCVVRSVFSDAGNILSAYEFKAAPMKA